MMGAQTFGSADAVVAGAIVHATARPIPIKAAANLCMWGSIRERWQDAHRRAEGTRAVERLSVFFVHAQI